MDDLEVVQRINELAGEEHRLERAHAGTPLSDDAQKRLRVCALRSTRCCWRPRAA